MEVRAGDGAPLPGFSHADCDRVDMNQLAAVVTWRGQTTRALTAGNGVRLDVRLTAAKLYALTVARPEGD